MKKQPHTSVNKISDSPFLGMDMHSLIEWITQYGKSILTGLLSVLFVLLLIYFWISGSSSKDQANYQMAAIDFQNFEKAESKEKQEATLNSLLNTIQQQPNLHAQYDGAIAQKLIDRNQIKEAMPFAEATLKRVAADHLPFYQEYAQITLLAAQGENARAIEQSIQLKDRMLQNLQNEESKESASGLLFAFNLLRIAFLQQTIGDNDGELKSWEEWKRYTNLDNPVNFAGPLDTKPFFTVSQLFTEGSLTLNQYIDWRIKNLSSQS